MPLWGKIMSKIVIALGGNALGKNPKEQLDLLKNVAKIIVNLIAQPYIYKYSNIYAVFIVVFLCAFMSCVS